MALIGASEAMTREDRDGVCLNLIISNALLITKHMVLSRTVTELLLSITLFPDPDPSVFCLREYLVILQRTHQHLDHSLTLESAGVQENDTLEITPARPKYRLVA